MGLIVRRWSILHSLLRKEKTPACGRDLFSVVGGQDRRTSAIDGASGCSTDDIQPPILPSLEVAALSLAAKLL